MAEPGNRLEETDIRLLLEREPHTIATSYSVPLYLMMASKTCILKVYMSNISSHNVYQYFDRPKLRGKVDNFIMFLIMDA